MTVDITPVAGPRQTTGEPPPDRTQLRVAVLLQGLSRGLQQVKYAAMLDALREIYPLMEVWDVDLARLSRLVALARSFHPDRSVWRARFHAHPATFERRTVAFRSLLTTRGANIDAFLQVGVLYDVSTAADHAPVVVYTDHATVLTAELGRSFRMPLAQNVVSRRIAQERDALTGAVHICTRSRFVADAIADRYGIDQKTVSVVGGGANVLAEPPPDRDTAMGQGRARFLFVGREYHRKGGDLVIKAFERLHAAAPSARLTMVTSLKDPPQLAGVRWLDNLSPGELAEQYAASDGFVLASRFETWGDVLIEAMSAGLVCICPDRPPFDEIITDGVTGHCVDVEDAGAVSKLMLDVASDPDKRRAMSEAARAKVLADFTWPAVAAKLARRIDQAARHGPRHGTRNGPPHGVNNLPPKIASQE